MVRLLYVQLSPAFTVPLYFLAWFSEASNNPPDPEAKYKQSNRRANNKSEELGRILTLTLLLWFGKARDVVAQPINRE
jgi:hypothetical protein